MNDPKYKDIGDPADKLIEECAEFIQAICKGERFGWENHHPEREETNRQELHNEWLDMQESYFKFKRSIATNQEIQADNLQGVVLENVDYQLTYVSQDVIQLRRCR